MMVLLVAGCQGADREVKEAHAAQPPPDPVTPAPEISFPELDIGTVYLLDQSATKVGVVGVDNACGGTGDNEVWVTTKTTGGKDYYLEDGLLGPYGSMDQENVTFKLHATTMLDDEGNPANAKQFCLKWRAALTVGPTSAKCWTVRSCPNAYNPTP